MKKISVIVCYNDELGYDDQALNHTIESLMHQNYENWELIVIDERENNTDYPSIISHEKIKHLPINKEKRAEGINKGLQIASGDFVLFANNVQSQIIFRLSTLEIFLAVAERRSNTGLVYADYQLIDDKGWEKDIHLLDYHEGRVRDNMDFGALLFFPKSIFTEIGYLEEKYKGAYLYDLRLKISEKFEIVHIAAAKNGHAYLVKAPEKRHDVFDYLISDKGIQLEMEQVLTGHLQRINAFLAPEKNYHHVKYSPDEEKKFETCIASVVIPVYDRVEFIGTAIESVQAQTVQNIEVIVVVNGGPNDPTIKGVKPYLPGGEKHDPNKPDVKLIIEDINNIGHCLNKGLRAARGKFYVQLDSDDRLKPNAVEKLIEVYDSDDRIGMVIGSYEVWEKNETTGELSPKEGINLVKHEEWTEENGRNNLLRINGAGAPRSAHIKVIRELGWFGMNDGVQSRNYGEDYDLVLRTSEQYRIGRVWEAIYDVIRHAGGTDHSIDQATIDRNDNAKDFMRLEAIRRRKEINFKS